MIASGRPVPGAGVVNQRGEGVAIVLSGPAVGAWRPVGNGWKAWNSRLVSATLKLVVVAEMCCAAHGVMLCSYFYCEQNGEGQLLQFLARGAFCNSISGVLGDFNARVGSRMEDDDEWRDERGPHGLGVLNEAGR